MRGLAGRKAIVTGGGGAIGQAISLRLGDEGCHVGIFDIDGDAAADTARLIVATGGEANSFTVDVTDYSATAAAVKDFGNSVGSCEILVNNAGLGIIKPISEMTIEEWQIQINVNLGGVFYCSKAALPHLITTGDGFIINIANNKTKFIKSFKSISKR